MRTGLTKRQKTTEIFFDETKSRITVYTHNTDLKKRLTAFAGQHPDHCIMTDEDTETGYKAFEIEKGRLSFRLTAPYSEERRQAASEVARCNPLQFRKKIAISKRLISLNYFQHRKIYAIIYYVYLYSDGYADI